MNKHSSIKSAGSLLERANEVYDFGAALRGISAPPIVPEVAPAITLAPEQVAAVAPAHQVAVAPVAAPAPPPSVDHVVYRTPSAVVASPVVPRAKAVAREGIRFAAIDRAHLVALNFIDPDGPVTGLSEEFRIVKRQLLLAARGGKGVSALEHGERILVCSANPNEGKTYCALNLALSMASEKDNRVLLVDADFAKPSILRTLEIEHGPGLMDALADPSINVEDFVIETDIDGLSILPAGAQTNQDTEYLAASRTAQIIDQLTRNDPSRIIIFDSPPALAASPASVLALHVGQILMIVHADVTNDSALRDAISLLSGCDNMQLLLNKTKFSPTGRKFGNYYGYGA
jgi:protein-tyrosine kinase